MRTRNQQIIATLRRLVLLVFATSAYALEADTAVARLEKDEATWHRFMLFRTPLTFTSREDMLAALNWFRDRTQSRKNIDSRYPITYSFLLWQTGLPTVRETSIGLAMAGYVAMQIEAARCLDQPDARRMAAQWAQATSAQLQEFEKLPRVKQKELGEFALKYVDLMPSAVPADSRVGPLWLCHQLPSYYVQIKAQPDVVIDQVQAGSVTYAFMSHPTIRPALAPAPEFAARRESILAAARQRFEPH